MRHSFKINTLLRILMVVALSMSIGWSLFTRQSWVLTALFFLFLLIFVISLIQYQNRVIEKITYFFEAVKNEDFSQAYPNKKGDPIIRELNNNLNEVNKQIQQIKIESHQQEQYFQALIEHVGTGILTYDEKGFVLHANSSIKKMLGLGQFTHMKQLEKVDEQLLKTILNMPQQGRKLVSFKGKQGQVNLSIKSSLFKNHDKQFALLSVQDINQELDEKELDSWMRLIRVLTHEIMNSIAPVTSLSESISNFFVKDGEAILPEEVNEKMIKTTIRGLEVIREQGRSLISFVESYRKLTRLPKPEKNEILVAELLEKMVLLNRAQFPDSKIQFVTRVESPDISIHADEKLISQVLINLLKNSQEALIDKEEARIELLSRVNKNGQVELCVKDNGPGIPKELQDEIFVPFFTTREKGSGIGLSLSRQIMRLHGGGLSVHSIPDKETIFCMRFN